MKSILAVPVCRGLKIPNSPPKLIALCVSLALGQVSSFPGWSPSGQSRRKASPPLVSSPQSGPSPRCCWRSSGLGSARQLQTDYYRANPFWTDPLRQARYLKQIALMPAWAKEVRIFGLTEWLTGVNRGRGTDAAWTTDRSAYRRQRWTSCTVVLMANGVVLWLSRPVSPARGTLRHWAADDSRAGLVRYGLSRQSRRGCVDREWRTPGPRSPGT